jgi:hypothetical protein
MCGKLSVTVNLANVSSPASLDEWLEKSHKYLVDV